MAYSFKLGKVCKLYANNKKYIRFHSHETLYCIRWEHTGSNRGPSACKADALNQLSYAPFVFGIANITEEFNSKK